MLPKSVPGPLTSVNVRVGVPLVLLVIRLLRLIGAEPVQIISGKSNEGLGASCMVSVATADAEHTPPVTEVIWY